MTTATQINDALADLVADGARLNAIVNGDSTTDVTLEDGSSQVPTIAKLFASISNQWRAPMRLATTAALPNSPTYSNGAAGLGATLTATSNGALSIDDTTVDNGNRVLIKDQANTAHNGPYEVTDKGSVSAPYVLTRVVDADTAVDLVVGIAMFVQQGGTNSATVFGMTSPITGAISVGTTGLSFGTQASVLTTDDLLGIDQNIPKAVTGNYSIIDSDGGKFLTLGGSAQFSVAFTAASNYSAKFRVRLKNIDSSRWKYINIDGTGVWLRPGQEMTVRNVSNVWRYENPGRWVLNSNLTIWASATTGSASNDGMTASAPLTPNEAANRLHFMIDQNGYSTIVQFVDEVAPSLGSWVGHWVGAHVVTVQGNISNYQATRLNALSGTDGMYIKDYCAINAQYFYITGNSGSRGLVCEQFGILDVGSNLWGNFGSSSSGLVVAFGGAGSYTAANSYSGNITYPLVFDGCFFSLGPWTHIVTQAITVTAFALLQGNANVTYNPGYGWSGAGVGSVTGKKYDLYQLSLLRTGGGLFPGLSSGTTDGTGYVN